MKYEKPKARDLSSLSTAEGVCASGTAVGVCNPNGIQAGSCGSAGFTAGACGPSGNTVTPAPCLSTGNIAGNCTTGFAATP